MLRPYEMPWRSAYESYAATAWTCSAAIGIGCAAFSVIPSGPLWTIGSASVGMATWRWVQAYKLWSLRLSIIGRPITFMTTKALLERVQPGDVWLGWGFDWKPEHSQRVYELRKTDPALFYPPKLFLKMLKREVNTRDIGAKWIHGVEPNEADVHVPFKNLEGHTVIFGTTGCGKTRTFDNLITQAIHRGDVVIIIDPKGDAELREIARRESKRAGREFIYFHPAFPQDSARIDPLKNWNRVTEIASRIAALVPSETGADAFTAFAWDAINVIANGLVEVEDRPNIAKLRQFIQGGPEPLVERTLVAYFKRVDPDRWQTLTAAHVAAFKGARRASTSITDELLGYVSYYKTELSKTHHSDVVDSLVSMFEHSRDHFSKMIASLIPILSMLTSGDLGKLLSPDQEDQEDPRPILDIAKLINARHVVYFGLDALSDATVSGALGSIYLADAAAVAGARYNFGCEHDAKVSLFVDEASEVVNTPFLQILNKARGSGFVCTVATQTLSDFVAKLGSEDKAFQLLGNFNNLLAMRTQDSKTQEYILGKLGETAIYSLQTSQGTNSSTEKNLAHFSGAVSDRLSETLEAKVPLELLGMLPNFEYYGIVAGGRIIKGRVPILQEVN